MSDGRLRRRAHKVSSRSAASDGPYTVSDSAQDGSALVGEDQVDLYMLRSGYALVFSSTACLFLGLWSLLIGPLSAPTGNWFLDMLAAGIHYKYLVVLFVPLTVCFVIVNWWGLKIFRHA
ncbi:hypothetical protein JCM11641_001582 [Rhodosporidiobolus odoratus]